MDSESQDFEDRVERVIRAHSGPGHQLRTTETWLYLRPSGLELPEHGWKLHISSRLATFTALVETLLPVLLDEECSFKLARSHAVLQQLNNGYTTPATVGKAFTVYARPERVHALGLGLAELLRGWEGPRVLSDRAVDPRSPVYYRYGPFTSKWGVDSHARLITVIHGPNPEDEEFGTLATMRYRQPSWTVDPFTGLPGSAEGDGREPAPEEPQRLGGHFRVVEGVFESGRGNVYRAVDERADSAGPVIIKQARALVDETDASGDARLRIRNERRILQALTGVAGVPRFIDHFRHGADEFLVTGDAGSCNLTQDVAQHGRYAPAGSAAAAKGARPLELLAQRLAKILLDVHSRGVTMRDLTPRNVMVNGDEVTLIDFGLAGFEGVHLPGGTPGYAPGRQRRHEPPEDTDDFFGLGMTLLYAESNVNPLALGGDLEQPRERALQMLRLRFGARPTGVMGAIIDLLSLDERAREASRLLAAGEIADRPCTTAVLPAPTRVDPSHAREICDSLLGDLLDQSYRCMTAQPSRSIAHDACIYSGAAGSGLELLHHLERPGVRDRVSQLARFAVRAAQEMDLPHGYLSGRTGVDVFVSRAEAAGIDVGARYRGPAVPGSDWAPEGIDLMVGAAGVGIGHLILHDLDAKPVHVEVARRCARAILDGTATGRTPEQDTLPPQAAVETSAGRAHGLAGTTEFLLYYAHQSQDTEILAAAADWSRLLFKRAESLLERLPTPYSAPIAASWCQGMAGINQTLLNAGDVLGELEFVALARRMADACIDFLPHISVVAQCCGFTGVGNILIDLAEHEGEQRYWDAAWDAARLMLLRSAGTPSHPVFVADEPADGSASWAFGNAGILAFFRRLTEHGGEWSLPMPARGRLA